MFGGGWRSRCLAISDRKALPDHTAIFFWKKVAVTKLENNEPVIHLRSEPKQFYK